jgi:hypothetical protein
VPNPGNVDDGPAIRAALADYAAGWASGTVGVLDFGSGHYRVSPNAGEPALRLAGQVTGAGIGGRILGDGENACSISADPGVGITFKFDDFWNGQLAGISLTGASNGQVNGGSSTDYGFVFGANHQDLGAAMLTLENFGASGFARGFVFGQDVSPLDAAAEIICSNLSAGFCGIGFNFNSYNTMDIKFDKPSVLHSACGFKGTYGGQTQISVRNGSSTNNAVEFDWSGQSGTFRIEDFRAEGGPNCTDVPVKFGGGNGGHLIISGSQFRSGTEYPYASVLIDNGNNWTTLEHNTLVGPVRIIQGSQAVWLTANSVYVQGTDRFIDTDPNTPIGSHYLSIEGNYQPSQINTGWFSSWHPMFRGFISAPDIRAGNLTTPPSMSINRLTSAIDDLDAKVSALDSAVQTITSRP